MTYPLSDSCQIRTLSQIYDSVFGDIKDGFFVDVGAFDGITYSNTWGLVKAGWSGVMFEAVPEYFRQCRDLYVLYSNIIVLCLAIGDKQGEEITINLAGAASSGSRKYLDVVQKTYLNAGYVEGKTVTVRTSTLDIQLRLLDVDPGSIDVVSIDTEGMEVEVLSGFSLSYWKPKMLIVETHSGHDILELRSNANLIDDYIMTSGYKKIYEDVINSIYTRRDAVGRL